MGGCAVVPRVRFGPQQAGLDVAEADATPATRTRDATDPIASTVRISLGVSTRTGQAPMQQRCSHLSPRTSTPLSDSRPQEHCEQHVYAIEQSVYTRCIVTQMISVYALH